jgi:hypothetical protein
MPTILAEEGGRGEALQAVRTRRRAQIRVIATRKTRSIRAFSFRLGGERIGAFLGHCALYALETVEFSYLNQLFISSRPDL